MILSFLRGMILLYEIFFSRLIKVDWKVAPQKERSGILKRETIGPNPGLEPSQLEACCALFDNWKTPFLGVANIRIYRDLNH
jgi:hypothetical protein